ncbi:MAG: PQQ-binding-like beta-propeller repeat protein [Actinobacteria bacterium]|nr:PQQ-binding-like beta-propeller repeat protein [Actinomycetota bacterium]
MPEEKESHKNDHLKRPSSPVQDRPSTRTGTGDTRSTHARSLAFRRIRAASIALVLVVVAWGISLVASGTPKSAHTHTGRSSANTSLQANGVPGSSSARIPAVEAGQLPWTTPQPIQRALGLPAPAGLGAGQILIAGGIGPSGTSLTTLSLVAVPSGRSRPAGNLPMALHDAAGATIGNRSFIFGGGTAGGFSSDVITISPAGNSTSRASGGSPGTLLTATVTGRLPKPRADASATVAGNHIYIVGGYNNGSPSRSVLATTNGTTFTTIATLPVPVRYPAIATLGHTIYVFGGLYVTGSKAGKPSSIIQAIDLATHKATETGHMPVPIEGASAVTLNGHIYVAGGITDDPSAATGIAGPYSPVVDPEVSSSTARSVLSTIWAFRPSTGKLLPAGQLRNSTAHSGTAVIGATAWLAGGESPTVTASNTEQMMTPNASFGYAGLPGAGSPYYGEKLLVADEGNNRLLVLDAQSRITWQYPSPTAPAPPGGFSADDAFFAKHGSVIVTNEENENVVAEIGYPSGKVLWTYGHFGVTGSSPGYLNTPDDAYMLKGGNVVTADIANCRVIVIDPGTGRIVHQIGTTGRCIHDQDHPVALGSPNGDTPLPNGNLLISEINGHWVDEYTMQGKLVWSAQIPISYPSDPQRLGPNRYLIADYTKPGAILEFNRAGRTLYRYQPASGPDMLDHPSLVEMLPSGVFMMNDDHNDRMIAIDPSTGALVWQYGITHTPGSAVGYLNVPDGFDILGPHGTTPTHPATG